MKSLPRCMAGLAAAALAVSLAGCGYKGPLTLPPKPGDVTVRPGPAAGTTATPPDAGQSAVPAAPTPPGATKPGDKPAKPPTDTPPAPPGPDDATRG